MLSLALPFRYFVPLTSINPDICCTVVHVVHHLIAEIYFLPWFTRSSLGGNHISLALCFLFKQDTLNVNNGLLLVFGGSSLFFDVTHFFFFLNVPWSCGCFGHYGILCPREGLADSTFGCVMYLCSLLSNHPPTKRLLSIGRGIHSCRKPNQERERPCGNELLLVIDHLIFQPTTEVSRGIIGLE
ncbi:hypothetical protein BC830DRAFT_323824 [Chytriomyces sp. MP71]|nr:hypothetical protein BC830DRAFT_323824 [Chytriomyces sp. MP71]